MEMIDVRTVRLILAALLAGASPLLVTVAASAAPPGSPAITLARPTGPLPTGTALLHLTDPARPDPLDPQHRPREVMAQLWYPSLPAPGKPLAPYAQPAEAAGLQKFYPVPAGAFTATTHSRLGASMLPGRHKMIFFHHGLCAARTDTTAINEQLASLGFVVVALGNTHESPAVEFPGGRGETTSDAAYCKAGGDPFSAANQAILQHLLAVRVADTRWVLDQIDRFNRGVSVAGLPTGFRGSVDTTSVGMFGHSFGGATTAAVLREDPRFVAGLNLDGFVIGPVAQEGLSKPFLVLGSSFHEPSQDQSWTTFLPALSGWHRWFRLTNAGHYRFIDLGGSVRKWGLEEQIKPVDPETWRTTFGDIDDRQSQRIVTRLTAGFFVQFLYGLPDPALQNPTRMFPEVQDLTDQI
jgi:pimeloyl-ACP methyl ester carboxylesterase